MDPDFLERVWTEGRFPGSSEAIDNLILWLGNNLDYPGRQTDVSYNTFQAIVGAAAIDGFAWVIRTAVSAGLIDGAVSAPGEESRLPKATLSAKGWERYDALVREGSGSRKAFMAMPFGDPELDRVMRDYYVPATKRADFDLERVDHNPGAGLIDDKIRVQIRTSRFVVAELTKRNAGVYWEAGFAEGIGRPVIYTCRKGDEPHFDTSHHVTVFWEPDKLDDAASRLTATIRATLPDEAKMTDDDLAST